MRRVFEAAASAVTLGRRAALATVIAGRGSAPRGAGAKMLVHADGSIVGTIGGGALEHAVIGLAVEACRTGRPTRFQAHLTRDLAMCCGGDLEVFVEPLQIREPVLVYGAGHVAFATAPTLVGLDYDVTVVDARPELATVARFPGCTVLVDDPVAHADRAVGGPDHHVLVVTHDHALDEELCARWLERPAAWVGVIGSRAKLNRFRLRLGARGLAEASIARLRGPVGLDLGAETPAEIGVSIAAEWVRLRRGRTEAPWPIT
jgi:xanthine dehydrogenase accessory factor